MPEVADNNHERRRVADYRLEQLEKNMLELRHELNEGIRSVRADIGQLAYVRLDVYAAEKAGMLQQILDNEGKADRAIAISMWALGLIVSVAIAGILAFVRAAG